jgi:predicted small lipoprotein YifL
MKMPLVGAAILAVLITLSACGQRGPLYLPKPPEAPRPAGQPEPAPDARR